MVHVRRGRRGESAIRDDVFVCFDLHGLHSVSSVSSSPLHIPSLARTPLATSTSQPFCDLPRTVTCQRHSSTSGYLYIYILALDMSLRIARPTLARQTLLNLTSRTSRSSLSCITSSALHTQKDQAQARPLQQQQRRTFLTTSIRTHEMSQGSHPHLKIAELFDVSGLTVAVTVSSTIS